MCLLLYVLFCWFGAAANTVMIGGCSEADVFPNHHQTFLLVWHSLVMIGTSVGGTFVMKKHRTALGLGLFIGCIIVLVNWTLAITVVLGGQIRYKQFWGAQCPKLDISTMSDTFALVLAIFLFLMYSALAYLLVVSKDLLLGDERLIPNTNYHTDTFSNDNQEDHLTAV